MTPRRAAFDGRYRCGRHAVSRTKLNERGAIGKGRSYLSHLGLIKNREMAISPARRIRAPLRLAVGHVCRMSSQEEVLRIHTRRIVAPVAHLDAVGDSAIGEFPGATMGQDFATRRIHHEATVSLVVECAGPDPAPAVRMRRPGPALADHRPKTRRVAVTSLLARGRCFAVSSARACLADVVYARGGTVKAEGVQALALPTLATPLRDLYRQIVHWVTSSGPVPGDVSRAGTFAWSLSPNRVVWNYA